MAMDPNENNNSSNQNNRNRQLTPAATSRTAHLLPPVTGGQSIFLFSRDLPMFHRLVEDTLRRCVREELHKRSPYFNLPPRLLPDPNMQARYRLQFMNKVKHPTFTTDLVRDKNGEPIRVELYDSYTQSIVSADCFISSVKVRIIVLDAEFWKNKGVNWSRSEFLPSMLRDRKGKEPILTGQDLIIRLENGVGTSGNIIFKDNSSWTKSGFRLGVMVEGEGESEDGYLNGKRVREGVSEPFRVKDRRAKESQKPDLLKLTDEVRCLKQVGNDRDSLLQKKNIKTVEDFLKLYYNDEPALREILGIKSKSDKCWKYIIEHAMQCADEFHAKCNALNNSSQPRQALVHTPGRTVPLQTIGGHLLVGSGSSVPNPCENNLLIPGIDTSIQNVDPIQHTIAGVLQVEVSSDLELLDNMLANGESNTNNNFQSPSRSNSFDADLCEALVQQFKARMSNSVSVGPLSPRRKAKIKILLKLIPFLVGPRSRARIVPCAIYQPLVNTSQPQQDLVHLNGGPLVVGSGSSVADPFENNIIEGDIPAIYGSLSPIWDIDPLSPTASGEHPVETQCNVFYDSNHANVESGNILNGDSMQLTNGGGSPQLELSSDFIPMEYPYAADAESTPDSFTQYPSRSDDFVARFGACFTGSKSNSVHVWPPLTPRRKRKMNTFFWSVTFVAAIRKRARIVPPAN